MPDILNVFIYAALYVANSLGICRLGRKAGCSDESTFEQAWTSAKPIGNGPATNDSWNSTSD